MSSLSEHNSRHVVVESDDSQSNVIPTDPDFPILFEEDYGSIDPLEHVSRSRRRVHIELPARHSSVFMIVSGSDVDTSHSNKQQHSSLFDNPKSQVSDRSLDMIRVEYGIPKGIELKSPSSTERIDTHMGDWCAMYLCPFYEGFKFPFPKLISSVLSHYQLAPCQLLPNSWKVLLALCRFSELFRVDVELDDFLLCYTLQEHDPDQIGGKVLIHCFEGKSRSATVVLSYLMLRKNFTLLKAWNNLKRVHRRAQPNDGFAKILVELDRKVHGEVSMEWQQRRPTMKVCPICGKNAGLSNSSLKLHLQKSHKRLSSGSVDSAMTMEIQKALDTLQISRGGSASPTQRQSHPSVEG